MNKRREKHDPFKEKGFEERVHEEASYLLHNVYLYEPKETDLKPVRNERHMIDPDFYKDHLYVDEEVNLTQHPYEISMEKLERMIHWCKTNNYRFYINGASPYFPGRTIQIKFRKVAQKRAEDETEEG